MSLYIILLILTTIIAAITLIGGYLLITRITNKRVLLGKGDGRKIISVTNLVAIILIALFASYSIILSVENAKLRTEISGDNHFESLSGTFFQKTYGSIGMINSNTEKIYLEVYCFNEELKDDYVYEVDNANVKVTGSSFEEIYKENELIVYSLALNVKIKPVDGQNQYDIKTVKISTAVKIEDYEIGNVSFVMCKGEEIGLMGSCDSCFTNGVWKYEIAESNEEEFEIADCICAVNEHVRCSYDKNVCYTLGKKVDYKLMVDDKDDGDGIVMKPVFKIVDSKTQKVFYYTPNILVTNGKGCSYKSIREYVER